MKTTWTDSTGRTWTARMTIGEAERLRQQGCDLLDPDQLKQMIGDPFGAVELIRCAHVTQMEEAGVPAADFIELCTETEAIATASAEAMVEALADFFARLRKPALARVLRMALDAANAAEARSDAMVAAKARPLMDRGIEQQLKRLSDVLDGGTDAATSSGTSGA